MQLMFSIWRMGFSLRVWDYAFERLVFVYLSIYVWFKRWDMGIELYQRTGFRFNIKLPFILIENDTIQEVVGTRIVPVINGKVFWKKIR